MAKATTRPTLEQVRERVLWARDHTAETMTRASGQHQAYVEGMHDMADWVLDMIDGKD